MTTWALKQCSACGGDLLREGQDGICLQCGRSLILQPLPQYEKPTPKRRPKQIELREEEPLPPGRTRPYYYRRRRVERVYL